MLEELATLSSNNWQHAKVAPATGQPSAAAAQQAQQACSSASIGFCKGWSERKPAVTVLSLCAGSLSAITQRCRAASRCCPF